MTTLTVSSKSQIVIPREFANRWHPLLAKSYAIEYRGRLELVPVKPIKAARGSLQGINTDVPREPDRV